MVKLLVLLLTVAYVTADDPGVRLQASQKAVDYIKNEGLKILTEEMNAKLANEKIPEIKGEEKWYNYWVKNIRVTKYNIPTDKASVKLTEPNGVQINVDLIAEIAADYTVQIKLGIINPIQMGSITAKATINGALQGKLVSAGGKAKIEMGACKLTAKDLDLDFHGNFVNKILNLIDSVFEKMIKNNLSKMVCSQLHKAMDEVVNKRLAALPMKTEIQNGGFFNNFGVDYALSGNPVVQGNKASMGLRGRITYKGHGKDSAIPKAVATKSIKDSKKMFCVVMDAEAVLGSAAYAIEVSDKAHIDIDHEFIQKLGVDIHSVLQCNCTENCLGFFVPQIQEKCGTGGHIKIAVALAEVPKVDVTAAGLDLGLHVHLNFSGLLPDDQEVSLFNLGAKSDVHVDKDLHVEDWKLKGHLNITDTKLHLVESSIGDVDPLAFELIWEFALKIVAQRLIEDLIEKGIPLPKTQYIKVVDPKLEFADRTVSVCFDAQYIGPHKFS